MKSIKREVNTLRLVENGGVLVLYLTSDDIQAKRAEELEALAMFRIAKEVLRCRSCRSKVSFSCKRMQCPSCSKRRSKRNFKRVLRAVKRMNSPQLLLLTWRSESLDDARATVLKLRRGIVAISRTDAMVNVRTAIGGIELKVTDSGRAWNAHCHLVIDVDPKVFDARRAAAWWKRRTSKQAREGRTVHRGTLSFDDAVRDREKIATYITKQRGWSPAPGRPPGSPRLSKQVRLLLLERVWEALRGVHLVVGWRLKDPRVARSKTPPRRKRRSSGRDPGTTVPARKRVQERVSGPGGPASGGRARARPARRGNPARKVDLR